MPISIQEPWLEKWILKLVVITCQEPSTHLINTPNVLSKHWNLTWNLPFSKSLLKIHLVSNDQTPHCQNSFPQFQFLNNHSNLLNTSFWACPSIQTLAKQPVLGESQFAKFMLFYNFFVLLKWLIFLELKHLSWYWMTCVYVFESLVWFVNMKTRNQFIRFFLLQNSQFQN